MKRITLLLALFVSFTAFAKDLSNDVIMVSYEQAWIDHEGTLALKNNTNEEIRNVVFLITYLDMSGKELGPRKLISLHMNIRVSITITSQRVMVRTLLSKSISS